MKSTLSSQFQQKPVGAAGKISEFQPRPLRARDGYLQFKRARNPWQVGPEDRVEIALTVA